MKGGSRGKYAGAFVGGVIGGATGGAASLTAGSSGSLGKDITVGAAIGAAFGAKAASNRTAKQGRLLIATQAILLKTCPRDSPILKDKLYPNYVGRLDMTHLDSLFLKDNGDRVPCPYDRNQFIKLMDKLMEIESSENLRGIFPYTREELRQQIVGGQMWDPNVSTYSQDKISGRHHHYMTKKKEDSLWAKYTKGGIKVALLISDTTKTYSFSTVPEIDHKAYITHHFVIIDSSGKDTLYISRLVYFNGYGDDGNTMGYVEFIPSDSLQQGNHPVPNVSLWKISPDLTFSLSERKTKEVEVKPLVVEVSVEKQRSNIRKKMKAAADADDMDRVLELDKELRALSEKDSSRE